MLLEIFDPKAPPRAIGIDLGTTNSLVAYVKNERPVAIQDCNQHALLPSAVHYGDGGDVCGFDICLRQNFRCDAGLGRPDVAWVVLHPAGLREDLWKFLLRDADDAARAIEEDGSGAGRTLVERENVFHPARRGRKFMTRRR